MIPIQTYFENIKAKTGKTPADFKKVATEKGFFEKGILKSTVKAGEIIAWLKKDFDLGHGHAMAIYHTFKEKAE
jgi:hypothetical protein